MKYHSDAQYPSVFWIVNGWNSVAGNMAAGAGTCGACYWIPSVANHDFIEVQAEGGTTPMEWSGYSAIQEKTRAGRSPIKLFYQNYCTTAMHSLNISDGSPCTLVTRGDVIKAIGNPMAPPAPDANRKPEAEPKSPEAKAFYPRYSGQRAPTVCNPGVDKDSARRRLHTSGLRVRTPRVVRRIYIFALHDIVQLGGGEFLGDLVARRLVDVRSRLHERCAGCWDYRGQRR